MNISEIAEKAGVSTATVSRVLNDSNLVKKETKERVLRVISECGYMPSAVAKSLSSRTTHNIGVICADIENPFFFGALKGVTRIAEENDYNVFFFNSDETARREHKFLRVVRAQRLDGLIISPVDCFDETTLTKLAEFERKGIPVVLLDRQLQGGTFSSVVAENRKGAYDAVTRLIHEGHRRIALIEGAPSNTPVSQRSVGYRQAMEDGGIPLRPEYMLRADQKSELAYQATRALMRLGEAPSAIFTCNNMMTLGCIRYLTERGLVLGRDVSLIGFDDIEVLRMIDYPLSVVDRSAEEMGRLAMTLLLQRLNQSSEASLTLTVPTKLILRGSEKLQK